MIHDFIAVAAHHEDVARGVRCQAIHRELAGVARPGIFVSIARIFRGTPESRSTLQAPVVLEQTISAGRTGW